MTHHLIHVHVHWHACCVYSVDLHNFFILQSYFSFKSPLWSYYNGRVHTKVIRLHFPYERSLADAVYLWWFMEIETFVCVACRFNQTEALLHMSCNSGSVQSVCVNSVFFICLKLDSGRSLVLSPGEPGVRRWDSCLEWIQREHVDDVKSSVTALVESALTDNQTSPHQSSSDSLDGVRSPQSRSSSVRLNADTLVLWAKCQHADV